MSLSLVVTWMCHQIVHSQLYSLSTSLPILAGYGTSWQAGSKLMTYGGVLFAWRCAVILYEKQNCHQFIHGSNISL